MGLTDVVSILAVSERDSVSRKCVDSLCCIRKLSAVDVLDRLIGEGRESAAIYSQALTACHE